MQWTEEAIAAALKGKFFLVDGRDKHEVEEREKREREQRKAAAAMRAYHAQQVHKQVKESGPLNSTSIIAAVAAAHGLGTNDLISNSRFRHICHARQHACALMRELTGLPFQAIAAAVGIVDHSTAHHAVRMWRERGAVYAVEDRAARRMLGLQVAA
jgi:chromosomal replication initiation ATPase DnaA